MGSSLSAGSNVMQAMRVDTGALDMGVGPLVFGQRPCLHGEFQRRMQTVGLIGRCLIGMLSPTALEPML